MECPGRRALKPKILTPKDFLDAVMKAFSYNGELCGGNGPQIRSSGSSCVGRQHAAHVCSAFAYTNYFLMSDSRVDPNANC